MANTLYTNAAVAINGAMLLEEVSVNVARATGSQPIFTVLKGYAGESSGANTIEIDVTNAVPTADFEFDGGAVMESLQEVEITVYAAGKRLTSKGYIISDSFKHSANSESNYDFKFRGKYAKFE